MLNSAYKKYSLQRDSTGLPVSQRAKLGLLSVQNVDLFGTGDAAVVHVMGLSAN